MSDESAESPKPRAESYKERRKREIAEEKARRDAQQPPLSLESEQQGAPTPPPDPETAKIVFPEPVPDPEPDAPPSPPPKRTRNGGFRKPNDNALHRRSEERKLKRMEEQQLERLAKARAQRALEQLEKTPQEIELAQRKANEAKERAMAREKAKIEEQDAEMARRVLARRRLIEFTKRFQRTYEPGWVHRDICRRLEKFLQDVIDGKSPRLMLFVPPRHGKSQLASINFPAWALGHHPELEFISSSYAISLPIGFSRKVRELIQDPAYKALFPQTQLDKNIASAETWATTAGGGYVASGVGSGITGKGANVLIVDDPVKDAESADSEVISDGIWAWYSSTFYTRAAPGAGILIIQTRWSDTDLAGRLLTQMKEDLDEGVAPEPWEIIQYPAVATHDEWVNADGTITDQPKTENAIQVRRKGEALHPERFPLERLERIKRSLQPRHWNALYQQNPVPDEGSYFTKDMFRFHANPPPISSLRMFAAWDLAISEKQQADYTVGVIAGLDHTDQLFVLDVMRFRGDAYKIAEAIVTSANRWQVELVGIEKGQLEQAIRPTLLKMMREKRAKFALAEGDRALVPVTDKLSRARPLQGRLQQGMIYFDNTQGWCENLIFEALRFPVGVHDDQVDALAYLVRMVMREDPPKPPRRQTAKTLQSRLQAIINDVGQLTPMAA